MRKTLLLFLFLLLGLSVSIAQNKKLAVYAVAFYNLENLFDTINQPEVLDEEFTPKGSMQWGSFKYNNKLDRMSYALDQLAAQYAPLGPAVIGVSEIENQSVLEDLVLRGNFAKKGYKVVHYDSPDRRGVDVGLLYNPTLFTVESSKSLRLTLPESPDFKTRDPLLVTGRLAGERIHILVNHWPSRLGGEKASRPKREAAAALNKYTTDSIYRIEPNAKIFIMGDLNDDPSNKSCSEVLNAKKDMKTVEKGGLYNPFWKILDSGIGSLAYRGNWNLFDQIIVSEPLLGPDRSTLKFWKAEVFNAEFLKQQDGKFKGYPMRTHAGGAYLNGYSDHFPTIVYLVKEVK